MADSDPNVWAAEQFAKQQAEKWRAIAGEQHAFASHDSWQILMTIIDDHNEGRTTESVALGRIGLTLLRLDGARRAALTRYREAVEKEKSGAD